MKTIEIFYKKREEVKLLENIIIFIERKSIKYLRYLYVLFMIVVLLINKFSSINIISEFFLKDFSSYIITNNSEIITIATIFIGIYFTVYTILMSMDNGSAFSRLRPRNKISLVYILNEGFFNSFVYVILSLLFSTMNGFFPLLFNMVRFGLLISFMYSALVFGVDMFVLIRKDIQKNIDKK
ncbi:hypothetical protein [Marinilactibacillus psychrotolerans]|uniref:hypothetical protein n=1 Tax=Marinilactibacillus psychrotolerans TaxID=191770 RepID=UPI00388EB454